MTINELKEVKAKIKHAAGCVFALSMDLNESEQLVKAKLKRISSYIFGVAIDFGEFADLIELNAVLKRERDYAVFRAKRLESYSVRKIKQAQVIKSYNARIKEKAKSDPELAAKLKRQSREASKRYAAKKKAERIAAGQTSDREITDSSASAIPLKDKKAGVTA
jgi:hypothetical protein